MKRLSGLAILAVAGVLFAFPGHASAQNPGQQQAGGIVVLDVSYVFKNHVRFKQQMEGLQHDVGEAEKQVKVERDQIKQEADGLEQYKSGSPEYKQREADLQQRNANLAIRVNMQKKDFLAREAKIYYTVYTELQHEVDYLARANGITAVLRFSREQADQSKPEEVLRWINQPIVWHAEGRDVTEYILGRLNAGAPPAAAADQRNMMGVPNPNQPQYPQR